MLNRRADSERYAGQALPIHGGRHFSNFKRGTDMIEHEFRVGDSVLTPYKADAFDLVITSPPYEDARLYGIDYKLKGDEYVEWCFERFREHLRICRGPVCWVIEGRTRRYKWSATPMLLAAKLHREGFHLRKPPVFVRSGIPGSGGPDWWRNDYEFVVCATRERGRLPWADATACGAPPKYPPGGAPSHHGRNGRIKGDYTPPALANPGNVIKGSVGKGHMGHDLAHENEAPFPLWLAERFVRTFCPPGGTVFDGFGGSGTTAHAAELHGRNSVTMDIRDDQVELAKRRLRDVIESRTPTPATEG